MEGDVEIRDADLCRGGQADACIKFNVFSLWFCLQKFDQRGWVKSRFLRVLFPVRPEMRGAVVPVGQRRRKDGGLGKGPLIHGAGKTQEECL